MQCSPEWELMAEPLNGMDYRIKHSISQRSLSVYFIITPRRVIMNKLFIAGISLALIFTAGTAMGENDTSTFQTLSAIQAATPMTGEELEAIEGRDIDFDFDDFLSDNDDVQFLVNLSSVNQTNYNEDFDNDDNDDDLDIDIDQDNDSDVDQEIYDNTVEFLSDNDD